jgi:hypothetical protein
LVSHDAGGAEILSSWLNRTNCQASAVVAGPAVDIFQRKCPQVEFLPLDVALAKCTGVLCGTGWQSSFERQAISLGRTLSKKTVAFLDHWVNYRERFDESGSSILPDEIWVGDPDAERIARALFTETPVLLQQNPYLQDLLVEIEQLQVDKAVSASKKILYVCENVVDHARLQYGDERYWGYTDYDALLFFLKHISALGEAIEAVTIRPHPSEQAEKYHWVTKLNSLPIKIGGEQTLLKETLEADIVVGIQSMAMVVGLLARKRVISSIPPGGHPCQLPHKNIEHMHILVDNSG